MPPKTMSGFFLGVELATDQLRASIVDENLELVGVESVDFDTELLEYQTHGGIFTTPGDAYTTPVEMWIKAFDLLMEKIGKGYDLGRIRAIGGAAQHALVWWHASQMPQLQTLDPRLPIHTQIPLTAFTMQNTPVAQDTSAHTHALALEAALGGPDLMAARVGTCAHASLLAAQLLRVREAWPEIWARTGKVQVASSFVASLFCGAYAGMGEAEACATGLWSHSGPQATGTPSHWDEGVLEIVGGSRDEGRRIWGWLGDVDISGGRRRIGSISRYLVERYGFDPETIVTPFTSDYLSTYLSLCPTPSDAVLSFGPMDALLAPATNYIPTRLYTLFPHPAQDASERRRYVLMLSSRNADVPRALVRDMYTKSWSAFDRLVAIVPPGGSIGLDDKLFSYWLLQGDSYPFSHVKGIFRFETGVKVNEFRDLRANPRCLLESQVLSFRIRWSRMLSTGVLGPNAGRGRAANASPSPVSQQKRNPTGSANNMGLPFDPYDYTPLPARVLSTGAAANFPSISNLVGDIFNAPVLVPTTQIDGAQVVPHRNAPPQGFPARAALGGSYVARWVWGKEKGTPAGTGRGGFEEEIRRLLAKRWAAAGGAAIRTNVNAPAGSKAPSAAGSGASTPYGHGARSALGATILVEEDEDEGEEMDRIGGMQGAYGAAFGEGDLGRMRTMTGSTAGTAMSGSTLDGPSTAFTTPDLGGTTPTSGEAPALDPAAPSTPAALTPVTAMPTSDAELQLGLAKVAEPDVDAFMSYAAIVPEFCRLEGLMIKSLV
ncbi:actin-like ATPase domain-containing protein [Fomitopsis serialis]|uniref:actin-like ATPase domain-containing protein n=1 Tax=Fomitopsis serialis TaxID=139415 RepID=UPI00200850BE|nr:actin-like ATPase domain-containing protein [Neoantrodia serialis]KAH9917468.1 actin-like ATPase domain-containing protein [Neoantrodia serialis]